MPLFRYKVAGRDGKLSELVIEADTQSDSLEKVWSRGLTPLHCFGTAENGSSTPLFGGTGGFDAVNFTNRLVPLLKAHIQLERALGIIAEGLEANEGKELVNELRRGLHEGKKLSEQIRGKGRIFPGIYANLVEAGEETGSLVEVMEELRRYLNDRKELRSFLVTSSIYPAIVLTVTSLLVAFLFLFVIPRFVDTFSSMGKKMPWLTKMMLKTSDIAVNLWWLWIALAAGSVILFLQIRAGGRAREWWQETVLKLPLLGGMATTVELSRFLRTLSVLVSNHVHLLTSVNIATRVIQNRFIATTLSGVPSELRGGSKLSEALAKSGYIPRLVQQMLEIGQETGRMGEMLHEVAEHYEVLVKERVKRLLAMFVPAIMLMLAVVIFVVVLAIFLAILELNKI